MLARPVLVHLVLLFLLEHRRLQDVPLVAIENNELLFEEVVADLGQCFQRHYLLFHDLKSEELDGFRAIQRTEVLQRGLPVGVRPEILQRLRNGRLRAPREKHLHVRVKNLVTGLVADIEHLFKVQIDVGLPSSLRQLSEELHALPQLIVVRVVGEQVDLVGLELLPLPLRHALEGLSGFLSIQPQAFYDLALEIEYFPEDRILENIHEAPRIDERSVASVHLGDFIRVLRLFLLLDPIASAEFSLQLVERVLSVSDLVFDEQVAELLLLQLLVHLYLVEQGAEEARERWNRSPARLMSKHHVEVFQQLEQLELANIGLPESVKVGDRRLDHFCIVLVGVLEDGPEELDNERLLLL